MSFTINQIYFPRFKCNLSWCGACHRDSFIFLLYYTWMRKHKCGKYVKHKIILHKTIFLWNVATVVTCDIIMPNIMLHIRCTCYYLIITETKGWTPTPSLFASSKPSRLTENHNSPELLTPASKLQGHLQPSIRHSLFNIFTVALLVWNPSPLPEKRPEPIHSHDTNSFSYIHRHFMSLENHVRLCFVNTGNLNSPNILYSY